jgi:hypothetical protein
MTVTSINIKRPLIEPFRDAVKEFPGFFDVHSENAHDDGSVTVVLHYLHDSYLFYLGAMTQLKDFKSKEVQLTPP